MTKKTQRTGRVRKPLSSTDLPRVLVGDRNNTAQIESPDGASTPAAVAMADSFHGLENHAKAMFKHMRRTFLDE